MYTPLHEYNLISDYYTEYLQTVNRYHNVTRPSIFVKYYNLNVDESSYDSNTLATVDIYKISDINFDLYDLTPAYFFSAISNRSANVEDLQGHLMDGNGTITVYTINRPKIHDLVVFYPPLSAQEIFRVVNITAPVNSIHASPSVTWYELELEYAPIKDISRIKLNNQYVYDMSDQKNILKSEFEYKINWLNILNGFFDFFKKYYSELNDVYSINSIIPLSTNNILYYIKKEYGQYYKRLFETFKCPYGLRSHVTGTLENLPIEFDINNNKFEFYDMESKNIYTYIWDHKENIPNCEIDEVLLKTKELYLELIKHEHRRS